MSPWPSPRSREASAERPPPSTDPPMEAVGRKWRWSSEPPRASSRVLQGCGLGMRPWGLKAPIWGVGPRLDSCPISAQRSVDSLPPTDGDPARGSSGLAVPTFNSHTWGSWGLKSVCVRPSWRTCPGFSPLVMQMGSGSSSPHSVLDGQLPTTEGRETDQLLEVCTF